MSSSYIIIIVQFFGDADRSKMSTKMAVGLFCTSSRLWSAPRARAHLAEDEISGPTIRIVRGSWELKFKILESIQISLEGTVASSDPTTALQPLVSVTCHLLRKFLSASCHPKHPKTMGPQPQEEGMGITRSCISSWRQIGGDLTKQTGFTTSNGNTSAICFIQVVVSIG